MEVMGPIGIAYEMGGSVRVLKLLFSERVESWCSRQDANARRLHACHVASFLCHLIRTRSPHPPAGRQSKIILQPLSELVAWMTTQRRMVGGPLHQEGHLRGSCPLLSPRQSGTKCGHCPPGVQALDSCSAYPEDDLHRRAILQGRRGELPEVAALVVLEEIPVG